MDYEKKYNEALERARALWREAIEKEYAIDYLKDYETIFPELRESEKPVPNDLDFEQELYNHFGQIRDFTLGMRIGQYFYNLGGDSVPLPEDTVLFQKGVAEGKRLMMEEAVEGLFQNTPFPTICLDDCKDYNFKGGDKVRVIVIPNTDKK